MNCNALEEERIYSVLFFRNGTLSEVYALPGSRVIDYGSGSQKAKLVHVLATITDLGFH